VASGQLPLEAGKVAARVAFPSAPEKLLEDLFAALTGFVAPAPAGPAAAGRSKEVGEDQADEEE
jgi:hypothetical protein